MIEINYKPMDDKTQQIIDSINRLYHTYIKEYIHSYGNDIWIALDGVHKNINPTSNFVFTKKYIIYLDKINKEYMIRKLKPDFNII